MPQVIKHGVGRWLDEQLAVAYSADGDFHHMRLEFADHRGDQARPPRLRLLLSRIENDRPAVRMEQGQTFDRAMLDDPRHGLTGGFQIADDQGLFENRQQRGANRTRRILRHPAGAIGLRPHLHDDPGHRQQRKADDDEDQNASDQPGGIFLHGTQFGTAR